MKRCLIVVKAGCFEDYDLDKTVIFLAEGAIFGTVITSFNSNIPDFRIFNVDNLSEQDINGIKAQLELPVS